jgi:predicted nucleotidyltransferase
MKMYFREIRLTAQHRNYSSELKIHDRKCRIKKFGDIAMLPESDLNIIISCAKKYDVSTVYLFGSSLDNPAQARDIDLGIKGIQSQLFFKFYGELLRKLSKNVDLVDLSKRSLFTELVEERGVRIYG